MFRNQIHDARGKKVTQLDPVALQVLNRNEPIERKTLAAINQEPGIRRTWYETAATYASGMLFGLETSLIIRFMITGDPDHRRVMVSGMYFIIWPFIVWFHVRKQRMKFIAGALLRHFRCPHCGYDLRGLPCTTDTGATICPECGCAWKLDVDRK